MPGDGIGTGSDGSILEAIDELRVSDVKMRYISYDARRVFKALKVHSYNAYDQAIVILWCNNYGINTTHSILSSKFDRSIRDAIDNIVISRQFENKKRTTDLKKISFMPYIFDPIAIQRLIAIDRAILVSDYEVRLDRLFEILATFRTEAQKQIFLGLLDELAEFRGRCSMWAVLNKLEEYMDSITQAVEGLAEFDEYAIPPRENERDPEAVEMLRKHLEFVKKARESHGPR